MEYEQELQCPNCKVNSLVDIGNWDDEKVFRCASCRVWFRESYIRENKKDELCLHEIPL